MSQKCQWVHMVEGLLIGWFFGLVNCGIFGYDLDPGSVICLRQLSIVLASWLNHLSPRQPIIEIEYEKWLEDNHNVSALRMVSLWLSNLPRGCSVCSLWYMDAWGIALPPWRRVATGKVFRNMVTGEKNLGLLNSLPPSDIVINRLSDLLAFPKGKPFPLYLNTFLS